jgi:diphthine-ammonia ligase
MATSLNVVALISGGKDSLFSILHCQANGHNVVALANLHPADAADGNEDIDSYMYQTVGHSIIPLYEQALGIPLFRQEITGKAVNSSRDYELPVEQEQDETEDLVPLLQKVIAAHPEANAVSTGAILSTYQRTRVESVAVRLGLTPLSYLWQYPTLSPYTQSSLLRDMAAVGQEAIIIKTASGGLDESFLGLNVADRSTITKLSTAMARYGEAGNGAIVGEGGEFETLALDGPKPLWRKRIKIGASSKKVVDGGQTVLKITECSLEEKSEVAEEDEGTLRVPELFDEEFKRILDAVSDSNNESAGAITTTPDLPSSHDTSSLPTNASSDTPTLFTYSNLTVDARSFPNSSPSQQLSKILLRLEHVLTQWNLSSADVNHATLLLRNMSDFTLLNPIYAHFFKAINPPARVTIAVGDAMPTGVDVMLSVVLDKEEIDRRGKVTRRTDRQGLHVQSRSYWAPANIGPYSQAVSVSLPSTPSIESSTANSLVYIAGQIPLLPAPMTPYTSRGFPGQAVLSLQHLWRIGRTKGVRWWTAGVAFIPACDDTDAEDKLRVVLDVWKKIHAPVITNGHGHDDESEDNDVDPWDRMNRTPFPPFNDSTSRSPIPDLSAVSSPTNPGTSPVPPFFVAQVQELPRGVDVEWSAAGLTSKSISFKRDITHSNVTTTTSASSRSRFYTLEICEMADVDTLTRLGEDSVDTWSSATLYTGRGFVWDREAGMGLRGVQWIPCKRVWGEDGKEVRGVLVGRVDQEVEEERRGSGSNGGGVVGKLVEGLRRISG